jgi:hypothetical protein
MKQLKIFVLLAMCALITACSTATPRNINDACDIFHQHPKWYWQTKSVSERWGVPIGVQLAIIRQESHFVQGAAPPRTTLWGFIPWSRPTSAYGYAQAVDGTWAHYERATGQSGSRTSFAYACDFVGWYAYSAHKKLGISRRNAYSIYLAYHEGIAGYARGTYKRKRWLLPVAGKVQRWSKIYQRQVDACQGDIPRPEIWNLWLL